MPQNIFLVSPHYTFQEPYFCVCVLFNHWVVSSCFGWRTGQRTGQMASSLGDLLSAGIWVVF